MNSIRLRERVGLDEECGRPRAFRAGCRESLWGGCRAAGRSRCWSGSRSLHGGELLAADGGQGQVGEGMADEFGFDAALAIELLFEGEDDEHAVDVALDELDAVLLPGPELRADEEDDGNAEAVEFLGELEVDVGEVDEDGDGGRRSRMACLSLRNSR